LKGRGHPRRISGTDDIRLNHHVGAAANQQKMLHVVAPDHYEPAPRIDWRRPHDGHT
jgi:hypothetical protein